MPDFLIGVIANVTFWSGLLAWFSAQCTKMMCDLAMTHKIRFQYMLSTGGMPSAHSATVCALSTSIGWRCGWDTPLFALSVGVSALTMFDASTVRRATGQQARLLNEIIAELFRDHRFSENKLRELLGHTRLEVFMGMVMGILVAILVNSLWTIFL